MTNKKEELLSLLLNRLQQGDYSVIDQTIALLKSGTSDTKSVDKKTYPWTDVGNAQRFVDKYGKFIRYNFTDKVWYVFDGKTWQRDEGDQVLALATKLNSNVDISDLIAYSPDPKHAEQAAARYQNKLATTRTIKNMLELVKAQLPVKHGAFNQQPFSLNVKNGTLNLQSTELAKHSAKDLIDKIAPVTYSKGAKCPLWLNFLKQTFQNNEELIKFIQRAVGYSITGDTSEQVMFLLVGDGKNGKSVFINTIAKLLGNYAKNMSSQSIMIKRDTASHDLARLEDARLVISSESNEGERIDESLVKSLTGQDTIVARYMFGSEFEFVPKFKLWMATNHRPIIRGTDKGIWRRLVIVPFKYTVPDSQVDKHLEQKLEKELPGILNWALAGTQAWLQEGLQLPQVVIDEGKSYQKQMNIIDQFISDCIYDKTGETDKDGQPYKIKTSYTYQLYRKWAKLNGAYMMSNIRFGAEMRKKYNRMHFSDGDYYMNCERSIEGSRVDGSVIQ